MKHTLFCCFLFISNYKVYAQGETNNWLFGQNAGVSWNTGVPVAFSGSAMVQPEGAACISDKAGNLLFYTDGVSVWNRLHQVMINGTGLMGNYSTTQSAIIVPWPGDTAKYFVFTPAEQSGSQGFRYSVVDMSLQAGLGDVVAAGKNTLLYNSTCEKVTAVKHANGTDYWVISHEWNNNNFNTYLVTATGVNPVPVVSSVGAVAAFSFTHKVGYMKMSPDGHTLGVAVCYTGGYTEFLNFDNNTGQVVNSFYYEPTTTEPGSYGIEFSPGNRYAYVSTAPSSSNVYQYDLQAGSAAAILASKYTVASGQAFSPLQLAPDGKIYISVYQQNYLSVINYPDLPGAACGYQNTAVVLTGSAQCRYGLPNFMQSYFAYQNDFTFQNLCVGEATAFSTTQLPVDSALWNFGDAASGAANTSTLLNPSHVFSSNGTFPVTLITWKSGASDTSQHDVIISPLPVVNLGSDTTLCTGQSFQLNAAAANGIYLWQNNSTAPTQAVTQSGTYWVEVTTNNCAAADTVQINFASMGAMNLGNDTAVCASNAVLLNATTNGATAYLWSTGATSATLSVSTPGIYSVSVSNIACYVIDTIQITPGSLGTVNLGNDTAVCNGGAVLLNATTTGATAYLWSTGATSASVSVAASGTFWVNVSNGTCSGTDTIQINVNNIEILNLGNDTAVCSPNTVVLNALTSGAVYLWQDNSVAPTYTVTQSGNYSVTVSISTCSLTGSIHVDVDSLPVAIVGTGTPVICAGDTAQLCATSGFSSYIWNTGAATPCIITSLAGNYYVTVTDANNCTAESNHLAITVHSQPPVSISVNGDTLSAYGAVTYQWYLNGNEITGAGDSVYIANQAGSYTVAVTDTNGCAATSNAIVITGIETFSIQHSTFSITPNPFADEINIATTHTGAAIQLTDVTGRIVAEQILSTQHSALSTSNLSRGIYYLQIITANGERIIRQVVKH